MPRSNQPRRRGRRPAGDGDAEALDRDRLLGGVGRRETHPDGDWFVRSVSGAASPKTYRCPGCDQEVAAGTPHVVVWRAEPVVEFGGLADRRHWHTPCWAARGRRRPSR